MLSNPLNNIQILVSKLQNKQNYKLAIKQGMLKYQVKQFKIQQLTPFDVFKMYCQIEQKFYYKKCQNNQPWHENELRIYIWLLLGHSLLQKRQLSQMRQNDWVFFSNIFNHRNTYDFQFQALSIIRKSAKQVKWTAEEIKLLDSIIKSADKSNKWNQIGKNLFVLSNKKYFRTSKQCREYWINHLDPKPIKTQWTLKQDLELIKAICSLGKKWSKVSQKLGGTRTQHMVKNRYRSLYINQVKTCDKYNQAFQTEQQLILQMEKRLRSQLSGINTVMIKQESLANKNIQKSLEEFQSADVQNKGQKQNCIEQLLFHANIYQQNDDGQQNKMGLCVQTMQQIGYEEQSVQQLPSFKISEIAYKKQLDFYQFFNEFSDFN